MNISKHPQPAKGSYIYGPVPSRRLGRSLGMDLVPFKTCTYDCIYCQLGRTTNKTCERQEYVPADDLIEELRTTLADGVQPDIVTLSGSGEPTLHSGIGEIVRRTKELSPVPIAVLTNSSLLRDPEVAAACAEADLVLPSLDAATPAAFQKVNRPYRQIAFEEMVEGLMRFRNQFKGSLWLELMLISGVNDQTKDVGEFRKIIERIQPDKIHLNTVVRTPAEVFARPVRANRMSAIASALGKNAEVIADYLFTDDPRATHPGKSEILNLLARRPSSIDDICRGLGIHRNLVVKLVEDLLRDQKVTADRTGANLLYSLFRR